ncbi:DUF3857 domain-containing protein [Flavobacterium sp.]|uniref:DUF3857 domain-containing protein n=1 Tax=Flavobacterium sp. TaxID=239 RepID=UPI002628F981|nr:DUF3857 domain-containing protein [Flavobacterium sp.]MDD3004191.1 DUF3857 domain-containing protein [Flavobacterium sp.]
MRIFSLVFFLIFSLQSYCQHHNYSISKIPADLLENANAVVRLNDKQIKILSRKSMTVTTKRVVSIMNEEGLGHLDASEYFSNSEKIKSIEGSVLNKDGVEIKKIKRKDFKENSVSGGALITDGKILYLDYTPITYPFTLIYESVVETINTAFIPTWYPVESMYVSVEKATISFDYPSDLGFKFKEVNFESDHKIVKTAQANTLSYTANSILAYKYEDYSPNIQKFFPHVMFGLTYFSLEGVEGVANDWKTFGLWMHESLLKNTTEISEETQNKIKQLVGNEKDPAKIAKIVYKYVQDKTRYISIQLGIGGWKPMLAKDVDRLGYGDCKALTNYTRSLLQTVGVPSYYTVIYGDREIKNLQPDFVSMQGNHVILGVPVNNEMIWLECTSQVNPFGFQGNFTDNRTALIIKPDGGEIIKTQEYKTPQNSQISTGEFTLDENGKLIGNVKIVSKGTQYDNKSGNEIKSAEDRTKMYKSYFWHINNISFQKINLVNNKELIEFQEDIAFEASNYASKTNDKMMFALNAFNPSNNVPQRYRNRNNPFEIKRGFYDYDEVNIKIPEGFTVESKPNDFEIKDKYGLYKTEFILGENNVLLYKRTFQINPGFHDKSEYENFRKFRETVGKMDNVKIVLIKKA